MFSFRFCHKIQNKEVNFHTDATIHVPLLLFTVPRHEVYFPGAKGQEAMAQANPSAFLFSSCSLFFSPHSEARRESGNRAHISRSSNYS